MLSERRFQVLPYPFPMPQRLTEIGTFCIQKAFE